MGDAARRNPLSFESAKRRPVLLDRFGREIERGDLITISVINFDPPLFTVKEVVPNLTPSAPANTLRVLFEAQIGSFMIAGQPTQDLILVAKKPMQQKEPTDASEVGDSRRDN